MTTATMNQIIEELNARIEHEMVKLIGEGKDLANRVDSITSKLITELDTETALNLQVLNKEQLHDDVADKMVDYYINLLAKHDQMTEWRYSRDREKVAIAEGFLSRFTGKTRGTSC